MKIIETISRAWGWIGLEPIAVVGENDFGNLMVEDARGRYWRINPEDLTCTLVARARSELDELSRDQDFLRDWYMLSMVEQARRHVGPLEDGKKYCLKIPGPLGGEYGGDNLASIELEQLIRASGDLALQIRGLPDGSQVKLQIAE